MVNSIYNYPNNNGVVSGVPKQPKQKQNFGQAVSVPVFNQNDTFVSSKTKQMQKKGMSSGAKWAIGLGLTALVGAGIYLATRGKVKSSIPRQLAENIQFNPAQTLDEAAAFAKNNFGIEKFDVQDLGMANYINEGFTIASNKVKGKIVLPDIVKSAEGDFIAQVYNSFDGKRVMEFNPKVRSWQEVASDAIAFAKKHNNTRFLESIPEKQKRYNNATFLERIQILSDLKVQSELNLTRDKFHTLFHELGHLNHEYASPELCKKLSVAGTGKDIEKAVEGSLQSQILEEHLDLLMNAGVEHIDIGRYAYMYPNEFVADMYGALMSGKKLPQNIMEIYQKYGGPMI